MTKEQIKIEAKKILDTLGVKLEEITDDVAQEIVDWKESMDKETRRKCRVVWGLIGVIVGIGIGAML